MMEDAESACRPASRDLNSVSRVWMPNVVLTDRTSLLERPGNSLCTSHCPTIRLQRLFCGQVIQRQVQPQYIDPRFAKNSQLPAFRALGY